MEFEELVEILGDLKKSGIKKILVMDNGQFLVIMPSGSSESLTLRQIKELHESQIKTGYSGIMLEMTRKEKKTG